VIGTGPIETIPSSVASMDPLQIPVIQTEPLVTPTLTAIVLESQGPSTGLAPTTEVAIETAKQTQATSPIGSPSEGLTGSTAQPQPSPATSPDDDAAKFVVSHRTPMAGSSAPPPPTDPQVFGP
jgi:hypothetical protein